MDEVRSYFWKLSPVGRYPHEEYFSGWHGLVPWFSYMLFQVTNVRDENLAFTFLKDRIQKITPEKSRDLGLRSRGPFSPANYNTWYTTYQSPLPRRLGAALARFISFNYPHLATPTVKESAGLDLVLRKKNLAEQLQMLEQDYEFLKPWRQLSFAYALTPIAVYEITRWLAARAQYGMTDEERERAEKTGIWRVNRGFKNFFLQTGISAAKWVSICAAGATAGPLGAGAAYGIWSYINSYNPAYPPNIVAQWFMKRRATKRYERSQAEYRWKTVECPKCGGSMGVFAHWCPYCKVNVGAFYRTKWGDDLSRGLG